MTPYNSMLLAALALAAFAPPCLAQTKPAPAKAATPAAAAAPALPTPPGGNADQVTAGQRLFGKSACRNCHGPEAKGTPIGPDLTAGSWLWSDGALPAIRKTISEGVAKPKKFKIAMPPKGGMQFSDAELTDLASYVWAVGHHPAKP